MAWIGKKQAGGCSGGWDWPTDGAVIEVPEPLAVYLLGMASGDYFEADPPKRRTVEEPAPRDTGDFGDEPPVETPKRRGRPPRVTVEE